MMIPMKISEKNFEYINQFVIAKRFVEKTANDATIEWITIESRKIKGMRNMKNKK